MLFQCFKHWFALTGGAFHFLLIYSSIIYYQEVGTFFGADVSGVCGYRILILLVHSNSNKNVIHSGQRSIFDPNIDHLGPCEIGLLRSPFPMDMPNLSILAQTMRPVQG